MGNDQKIEQEWEKDLKDFEKIYSEVSKVYCHITNGRISKPNTLSEQVIAVSDDLITEQIDKELEELKKQHREELEGLKKFIFDFGCTDCNLGGELNAEIEKLLNSEKEEI